MLEVTEQRRMNNEHVNIMIIAPQLSKCLKFEAVCGVLTDHMI